MIETTSYRGWLGPKSRQTQRGWLNQVAREEKKTGLVRSTASLTSGLPGWRLGNEDPLSDDNPTGVSNRNPGPFKWVIFPEDVELHYGSLQNLIDTLRKRQEDATW